MTTHHPFIAYIRQRLWKRNQNFLAVIIGDTGSGKSYSAISLANMINEKRFSVAHIVFSAIEFMELLNSGKLRRGDVVIFDEAGVGVASREWFSQQNKAISAITQTFRYKNLAVIYTCPSIYFVDSQMRSLFHMEMETKGIDYNRQLCKLKPLLIQQSTRKREPYKKYPRIRGDSGGLKKVVRFLMPKPDLELVRAYEKKAKAFKRELNKDKERVIRMVGKKKARTHKHSWVWKATRKAWKYA